MDKITINSEVAKKSGLNEYLRGQVKDIKGDKALVYFYVRGISRWCNKSDLYLVRI